MVSRNCSCKLLRAVLAEISAVRSVAESDRVVGSAATISNSDVPSPPATAAADTAPCSDSADDTAARNSRSEASIDSRGFAIIHNNLIPQELAVRTARRGANQSGRCVVWQSTSPHAVKHIRRLRNIIQALGRFERSVPLWFRTPAGEPILTAWRRDPCPT